MARLVRDMHLAYGEYQVEFGDVAAQDECAVAVQATIVAGAGRMRAPVPVRTEFMLRDGRITQLESYPGRRDFAVGSGGPRAAFSATLPR